MKKLICTLATISIFNSCSNDDDDNQPEEFSIVGVWKPSREIVISGKNGTTLPSTAFSPCYQSSTFNFKSNNTLVSNIFENNISGNCASTGIETVPYSYNHSASTLKIDNEDVEIVSRTFNELQIVSNYEDEDGDGIDDKIIYVFIK
jgi:hypothetical protein